MFKAALRLFPWFSEDLIKTPFYDNAAIPETISPVLFIGLCVYLWVLSVAPRDETPEFPDEPKPAKPGPDDAS
ncbi:MAG: hypothetical protein HY815_25980 [Candidatus Riflebacteria bacterium]|nr:hypothetical protein [Candidatus Riflebacteria bacterium]